MGYKPLPIGVDNFEKLRKQEYYYADKTLLIKELLDNCAEVNLFTRPAKFGKSLNLSMLQHFFEVGRESAALFHGLKIMEADEKYLSYMNQYPVIMISLKAMIKNHFSSSYLLLRAEIINEFNRHDYLLTSDKLNEYMKSSYREILNKSATKEEYATCLLFLSQCLEKHFNQKVIILVDDYDASMESVLDREMAGFRQVFFGSFLKSNAAMLFAVMAGGRCVNGEEGFLDLSNVNVHSIISKPFGEYFGFTRDEIEAHLEEYDMGYKATIAASWYNGYVFGRENIFNPWSFLKYAAQVRDDAKCAPAPFWFHKPASDMLRRLLRCAGAKERMELEVLMQGGTITVPAFDAVMIEDIELSPEQQWSYLLFSGYLKKIAAVIRERRQFLELAIPNEEVKYIFGSVIAEWMAEHIFAQHPTRLYDSIAIGDKDKFQDELNLLLRQSICYMSNQDNFYYELLLGLLENMGGWLVKTAQEIGKGQNDLFLMRVMDRKMAAVMEVKVADSYRNLGAYCDAALRQIEEKNYEEELWDMGYETVFKYGIAFCQKDCRVKIK